MGTLSKKSRHAHMGKRFGGRHIKSEMYITEHAQLKVMLQEGRMAAWDCLERTLLLFLFSKSFYLQPKHAFKSPLL